MNKEKDCSRCSMESRSPAGQSNAYFVLLICLSKATIFLFYIACEMEYVISNGKILAVIILLPPLYSKLNKTISRIFSNLLVLTREHKAACTGGA